MSRLHARPSALIALTLALHPFTASAQQTQSDPSTPEAAAAQADAPAVTPTAPAAAPGVPAPSTAPGQADVAAEPQSPAPASQPQLTPAQPQPTTPPPVVQETTVVVPPPAVFIAPPETAEEPMPTPKLTDDHPVELDKTRFRPGKGLHFESTDKSFAIDMRLRAQMLYTTEVEEVDDAEFEESFQIRRARLQFGGHFFGTDNEFKAELAVSPRDVGMRNGVGPSTSPLLDFYFQFNEVNDLNLRVGQYKVPYSRQRVVSSGDLRLVDRSVVNSEFTLDRDIGLDIRSDDLLQLDMLRYYAGIYLGEGRNSNSLRDFGMMYLARVELLPLGSFKDYSEGDLQFSQTPKLSLGLAYAYINHALNNQGILGQVPGDGGTTNIHNVTADFVFRVLGLSVEGEFMWRNGKRRPGDVASDNGTPDDETDDEVIVERPRNGWGFMGQAGVLLQNTGFEIVARAALNRAIGNSSLTEQNEYGLGVNYYFAGHPFKLQADVFRLGRRSAGEDAYAWDDRVRVQLQAGF